ncbi:RNA polymerase sigma factor [Marinimicrococcus flavescens]|uniref:RNA polymerase sigma factor n=1 Tax=Marinimicrococcus flavescens TaxID=3031815 RepID=A0AAP3V324_9PROT|nr:RNA polymerase sigma factor [Marinimicrococcus flavescens]
MTQPLPEQDLPDRASDAAAADLELAGRIRAGDAAAFELVMRRHNRRLFRLARSVLGNAAEAEDVVQETWLRAYAHLGEFTGAGGLAPWLGRIALNEALGRLRRRGRVVSLDEHRDGGETALMRRIETMSMQQPDPERLAGSAELRRVLEAAIDALPDEFRTVFVLRAIEEMSVAETAATLSLRPETVKTRFHRARRRLQEALGARLDLLARGSFEFGGAHCDRVVATVLARLRPALDAAAARRTIRQPTR